MPAVPAHVLNANAMAMPGRAVAHGLCSFFFIIERAGVPERRTPGDSRRCSGAEQGQPGRGCHGNGAAARRYGSFLWPRAGQRAVGRSNGQEPRVGVALQQQSRTFVHHCEIRAHTCPACARSVQLQPGPSLPPRSAVRQFRSAQARLWLLIAFLFFPVEEEKIKASGARCGCSRSRAPSSVHQPWLAFWPEPCLGGLDFVFSFSSQVSAWCGVWSRQQPLSSF